MNIVIVDMDGVIADDAHRKHIANSIYRLPKDEKQAAWDSYHEAMRFDDPNKGIISHVNFLSKENIVAIVTGRPEKWREGTEKQLSQWGVTYDNLYMRTDGDKQSAVTLKKGIVEGFHKYGLKITKAIDDREDICKMYEEFNIPTWRIMT